MLYRRPRLMIAALRGGSGKTLVSLGLIAAWRRHHGIRVAPFKKGPDYIDAGWLSLAAGEPCYNLDPFLMSADEIVESFVGRSGACDISVIEGNRGLYDGLDARGSCSSAELAKLLKVPAVLVVDATKVTRTTAALVLGCQRLDPEVPVSGVIVNRVAGSRHERVVREAIEGSCGVPVLGVIPKEGVNFFPERHMGLVPPQEHGELQAAVAHVAERIREGVDLDGLREVAERAGPLGWVPSSGWERNRLPGRAQVTIGIVRDSAFQFYYPENFEALEKQGAALKFIDALQCEVLPPVDALYIGGGFPETHLNRLTANRGLRESIREAVEKGLPVYAECGGLMFLSRGIHHQGGFYPMCGVFPCDVVLERKPQGHGYAILECIGENPFVPAGRLIRGHEFHYSKIVDLSPDVPLVFRVRKGHGIVEGRDGLCYKNCLAGYTHIHAVGNGFWAEALVRAAERYRPGDKTDEITRRKGSVHYMGQAIEHNIVS